ncbi:DMT family transporter [Janthinobacterium fluminis]|uniref:DMT family transporter n=1 Tax=Janthinobacterium fluminis TaxID=2987524 RepID=A0ABT5K4S7_9BURK|nr:DMT family transporter [Janthinobacterium fluminis]MDC8759433.1 DMT family transporter [Janthinobacterium fluminis]
MTHQFRGILALLLVTLVWGTTFPAMKSLTAYFSPIWIVCIRFMLASVLMLPFLWRASLRDCKAGALVGAVLFICYVFQVEGLALTTSNRNAFITGLNVLVVPLLGYAAGKKPERRIVIALALALAGLFVLCSDGDASWSRGDTLALLAAFTFGLYVKMMEGATRTVDALMALTAMQIVTVALCAALWLLVREVPRTQIELGADALDYWRYIGGGVRAYAANFLYLGVLCTAGIIALQTWGQRHSTANEAAVIYAFEPGAAAFFAYFWLGEVMTGQAWVGAALLISGMIVSQWNSERPAAALVPE